MELYEEALGITKARLGNDHTKVADTLYNMAVVYEKKGDNEKALQSFEEAFRIYKMRYGDEHEYSIDAAEQVARVKVKLSNSVFC